ncbi:hypothetical protein [Henriciella sp.]|uniref:methyltransferase domain-containing protein n=1 Tax=Henriciella sp. TaxID=1968823 RepID=UPI000C0E078A|nr:hypothetical protein [Henriciella sp.]PHR81067.1 MAG: hypothetical protein COA64_03165 [Henriciella sp.]
MFGIWSRVRRRLWPEKYPVPLDDKIIAAQNLMREGDWAQAIDAWKAIIARGDELMPATVYARLIEAYRQLGALEDVEQTVAEAEAEGAGHISIYAGAAQAFLKVDRGEKALAFARKAASRAESLDDKREALALVASVESEYADKAKAAELLTGLVASLQQKPPGDPQSILRGQIERQIERMGAKDAWDAYWRQRQDYVYMHVIRKLIETVGPSARVVADIGSNRTPILDFYQGAPKRYSVDLENPYRGENVTAVTEDFYTWHPPEPVDLVTCFQTIEHVPDPERFTRRLLEYGEVVLLSVPHKEPTGLNPGHIQNDIDYDTIVSWAGREPNFHYIARELSGDERIICLFDTRSTARIDQLNSESAAAMAFRFRWGEMNRTSGLPEKTKEQA